ncbi:MAG: BsaWI family type II restriction enzyme [Bacteroidales bacterium]|jgi:type II restriction enzyme|nr:BsaWI family type II restriction enzyme [Bacteroidales bacterium]
MTIKDLIYLYEQEKRKVGNEAYRFVSKVLKDAKELHKRDFTGNDHEQSWRAFKGKNLEKLIEHIIVDEVRSLGLDIINGNSLERKSSANLSKLLSMVKRNLLIDYGEYGSHLPDVDIIIFNPQNGKVIAVLSSKVTLRERIAQTGYWKIKLSSDKVTEHIKVYFVTPDEDDTLTIKRPAKKGRAIVETDLDGSYVFSETTIEESGKVKMFDKFIGDLKKLIK